MTTYGTQLLKASKSYTERQTPAVCARRIRGKQQVFVVNKVDGTRSRGECASAEVTFCMRVYSVCQANPSRDAQGDSPWKETMSRWKRMRRGFSS
jgi:hypothetical protein